MKSIVKKHNFLSMSMDYDYISNHFNEIADSYNEVRDTDGDVIDIIVDAIREVKSPINMDIASGTARYPITIVRRYGFRFVCIDQNDEMLRVAQKEAEGFDGLIRFIKGDCSDLKHLLASNERYGIVTIMNALHHFTNITSLIRSVSDIMKDEGRFLIYTRLDNQNERTIWGRYFPGFCEKETRYMGRSGFPYSRLEEEISQGGMEVERVMRLDLQKYNTLSELLEKIDSKHYSTFCEYSQEELRQAREEFVHNIYDALPKCGSNQDYRIPHLSPMSMIFVKSKGH